MRIVTSLLLATIVLTVPLAVIAAPGLQSTIDIKTLALTKADLMPRVFEIVPDRTVSEDRADGVAVYDITFARERTPENLASGPFEIRSGVARTAQVDDAVLQLASTKEAFLGEGWKETGVPPLGDEALGLTQTTNGDGGQIAHYSYLFRKGVYILMIGVRGRPDVTKLGDAVGLAIIVSGRLDKALGSPAASSGASTSSGPTTRQGTATGERVRVLSGGANMRADTSTSADIVVEVPEGTTLDIIGSNKDSEDRIWRNVRWNDKSGWIASTLLETISTPPTPSPSPAPRPAASSQSSPPPASQPPADEATDDQPDDSTEATASPSPTSQSSSSTSSGNTFQGSGNGLTVEGIIRDLNLSGGKQQVKVRVTRNGGGVSDAFVNVTARLDAKRFRSIKLDNTNKDGYTEVEWDMEGPAGTYEVLVEAKTRPVTSAKSSFRWK
jgi:hypothetical protein